MTVQFVPGRRADSVDIIEHKCKQNIFERISQIQIKISWTCMYRTLYEYAENFRHGIVIVAEQTN